jgi:hypothetical protein
MKFIFLSDVVIPVSVLFIPCLTTGHYREFYQVTDFTLCLGNYLVSLMKIYLRCALRFSEYHLPQLCYRVNQPAEYYLLCPGIVKVLETMRDPESWSSRGSSLKSIRSNFYHGFHKFRPMKDLHRILSLVECPLKH